MSYSHRFCIAQMMDWTDRHCRAFHRILSGHALLYTEMVTTGALIHGDVERHLAYGESEHPVALQLGGSDPAALAHCAKLAEDWGYDEVNLNVGCPSDRVQNGRFGACLMAEPALVGECVSAMQAAVSIPVTVKTRVGIDRQDAYEPFEQFIDTVAAAGCEVFIVHARKAWLDGLSPKENRDIPPLRYDFVYRIKQARPDLTIAINGGIETLDQTHEHLAHVDGVMIGRAAYQRPYLLSEVDSALFGDARPPISRGEALEAYRGHVAAELARGTPLGRMIRPLLGLYHGQPGGRNFRRVLSEGSHAPDAGMAVLDAALAAVESASTSRRQTAAA